MSRAAFGPSELVEGVVSPPGTGTDRTPHEMSRVTCIKCWPSIGLLSVQLRRSVCQCRSVVMVPSALLCCSLCSFQR